MKIPFKCPICNGEGMINPWMQTTSTAKITCTGCNGTGIVWGEE